MSVVTNHQYGLFQIAKIFFQPLYGIKVEVVGRLVEQQVVRLAEERLREQYADLLLTAELLHQFVVQVFLDAQSA